MALRLYVLTADVDPPPSVLIKGRKVLVGRGADCEVRLPDPSVSAHHATIRKRGDSYILIDEFSSHGTGIVGHSGRDSTPIWLAPESPRVLEEGDLIHFGQIEVRVGLEAAERGAESGFEQLAPALVKAGLEAAGLEASEELIGSTLRELTDLEDELYEEPDEPLPEPVGVAALEADDRHPPWRTDLFVAGISLAILAACALGLGRLAGFV